MTHEPDESGVPPRMDIDPLERISHADREAWHRAGWFSNEVLADHVARHAATNPDGTAYVVGDDRLTWRAYDEQSTRLASALIGVGVRPRDRLAVMLPDNALLHTVFLAAEKAGIVVVGVSIKAGDRELAHLLHKTGATALLTPALIRDRPGDDLMAALEPLCPQLAHHLVIDDPSTAALRVDGTLVDGPSGAGVSMTQRIGPDELFLINSTSGTTGLPKCVMQHENRWWYFHQLAVEAAELTTDDVFLSVIPAPFGFGLWTSHFTPGYLGVPTVVMERFSAVAMLEAIVRHRVTVLCCVSTQFIMMLNELASSSYDLSSLRAMFTGGEAVPEHRAAEFEERTSASVLQFYGSNETGALSRTTSSDTRERRLRTAGRIIDDMHVRLFAESGAEIFERNTPGQPACKGPAMCGGYYDDDEANAELFTADGWMRIGDVAVIDDDGYLTVVGRTSDLIIRGGKNISAVQVESEIASHPDVAVVAVVAMPDDVFGERACAFVVPVQGASVTLDSVCAHLAARQVGKELYPERLEVLDRMPMASGGKIAKGELRDDIKRKLASEG